jgi:hypothetical protein
MRSLFDLHVTMHDSHKLGGIMKTASIALFLLVVAVNVWAQNPVADGVLGTNEYARTETKAGITVAASLSPDGTTLYLAVKAKTSGWVAIGAGSQKMDSAFMTLAFVKDSTQSITEETGKGKSHSENATRVLESAFAAEAGEFTTLEIALPASGLVKDKAVELIAAYGARDNRTSLHRGRTSFRLSF